MVGLPTDMPGTVPEVTVDGNQKVSKSDVLFKLAHPQLNSHGPTEALSANTGNDLIALQAWRNLQTREAARFRQFIQQINFILVIHISPCQSIEAGLLKRYSLVLFVGEYDRRSQRFSTNSLSQVDSRHAYESFRRWN